MVPSSWYQVLGTKYLVPSTWHQAPGTKYLAPSTWYQVLGTKYLVPSTWYHGGQDQPTKSARSHILKSTYMCRLMGPPCRLTCAQSTHQPTFAEGMDYNIAVCCLLWPGPMGPGPWHGPPNAFGGRMHSEAVCIRRQYAIKAECNQGRMHPNRSVCIKIRQ